jgi:hypothetical protein
MVDLKMKLDPLVVVLMVSLILVSLGVSLWWLPQKWDACGKLYDNLPAQLYCFNQ